MLVLSRNKGQSIVIGEDITVTIVDVHGGKVRIGIDAPQVVQVHRQETHAKLKLETKPKGVVLRDER